MRKVSVDIETLSEADLKMVGSHVYAQHPSTRLLCVAYAIDDGPVKVWRSVEDIHFPEDLYAAMADETVEFHAWNAGGFEMLFPLFSGVAVERWRCTMTRAAYWGLPMSLEQAATALDTGFEKDMVGRRLMLQMSKPRKDGTFWHDHDPEKYNRLCDYCAQDVVVERAIADRLPPLPDDELALWRKDYLMMSRGIPVDVKAVEALQTVAELSITRLDDEMRHVSLGNVKSVNAVSALIQYLHVRLCAVGIPPKKAKELLPSTAKEDIDAFLSQLEVGQASFIHRTTGLSIPKDVERMCRIRKEAAKSSVAKLQAMANCTMPDATIRGLTQFYGASRTGRWAGRLVQVQNLPRGVKGVDPRAEISTIIEKRGFYQPPKDITPLEVVSSCLRGCFKPQEGKFYVGDFSQIEARVVAWLAGQTDILDVFASGQDVYTYTANKLGSRDRQFGKVLVLACGFGMGAGKFRDTAATYGLALTEEEAKDAVTRWREANPEIVNFWYALERAVRKVLKSGTKCVEHVGLLQVGMGKNKLAGCLLIGLPSGRYLVYRHCRLVSGVAGRNGDAIAYDGVNQITRKWEAVTTYGGKLVENVVQAVARDLLALSLLRIPSSLEPLVTVHDEVICMGGGDESLVTELKDAMEKPPVWAVGLPIASDVKAMERYGK